MRANFLFRWASVATLLALPLSLCSQAVWAAGPSTRSQAPLISLLDFTAVEGALSTLVRTDFGITMRVSTRNLSPGDAVTLWLVVFNEPGACQNPTPFGQCSDPDLAIPDVLGDVMYAAGTVIGGSGRATFAGHHLMGDNEGTIFVPLLPPGVQSPGLINPRTAEVHLIVHTHGPMIPGFMPDMIQTFGGGCVDPGAPFFGMHFPEWGRKGPNTCQSLQFAIHAAN